MEVESTHTKDGKSVGRPHPSPPRKRRRNICMAVIAILLGLVLLVVILGLTVLKVKHPVTTISSVALKDLNFSVDIVRLRVYLNISLDVNMSIKNPNKIGLKYANSSAIVKYDGEVVGNAPIPAGKILAGQTLPMNLTLTLMADRLLSNSNVYSDVISGTLPLSTFTRISGYVHILKLFKIHVVSDTSCDIQLNLMTRTVANRTCQYKTKL